jgi:hypothetical protein
MINVTQRFTDDAFLLDRLERDVQNQKINQIATYMAEAKKCFDKTHRAMECRIVERTKKMTTFIEGNDDGK